MVMPTNFTSSSPRREEVLAPRVEQQSVRGPGRLRALRDEPGQPERLRRLVLAVEVAAPRVPAHEILGDVQRAPPGRALTASAAGVNTTVDDHSGASSTRDLGLHDHVGAAAALVALAHPAGRDAGRGRVGPPVAHQALAGLDHRVGAQPAEGEHGEVGGDQGVQRPGRPQRVLDPGAVPVAVVGRRGDLERERLQRRARPSSSGESSDPDIVYAVTCMICTMAYRAGVVGASGYTGAELLRLLAGHPEIDAVHVTADSNAGARVGRAVPVAGAGVRRVCSSRRSTPTTSPASTSCSSRCRTGSRSGSPRRCSRGSRARRRHRAPTSGSRPPRTSSGTARRTRRRS